MVTNAVLCMTDSIEVGANKIAAGFPKAEEALQQAMERFKIDPTLESPAQLIVQLDRIRIRAVHLGVLFEKVCESDVEVFLAVLYQERHKSLRATDIRSAVTRAMGGLTPPYYRSFKAREQLALVKATRPAFGKPALA